MDFNDSILQQFVRKGRAPMKMANDDRKTDNGNHRHPHHHQHHHHMRI